jgi:hypothetical protein
MPTQVEIANLAVVDCGEPPIGSFDDATSAARAVKAKYYSVRDTVLEAREWTFAKGRFVPTLDAAVPAWGYIYQHVIPSNVLAVPRIYSDTVGTLVTDWVREGWRILSNEAVIYAEAIMRVDEGEFSPGCVMCIKDLLVSEIAITLTDNRQLAADAFSKYEWRIRDAGASDGKQGRAQQIKPPALPGRRRLT